MANHLYSYNSTTYTSAAASSTASAATSAAYPSRSLVDAYYPLPYTYLTSSEATADPSKSSAAGTWPPGVDFATSADQLTYLGMKRTSEALYNQSVLGAQNEAWYSNYLVKRSRLGIASSLPVYPQRPGEKDCVHYMQTRTCKFGETCKFDHPIWVPEGGIPDWKEVLISTDPEALPVRPAQTDCPYFMKTKRCNFGPRCKFNHPLDSFTSGSSENAGSSVLPERPSEPPCAFYLKTGQCKFGATCKFNHPKDIQNIETGQQNYSSLQTDTAVNTGAVHSLPPAPAMLHNTKGLPIRPGEVDCPFYLKTGSCKYGATCRYNHPDRIVLDPTAAAYSYPVVASPGGSLSVRGVSPTASVYQTIDPRLAPSLLTMGTIYPQRPGHAECDYYMKTGVCKFGETCRFHHPIDRSASAALDIKLTLAGLPRREGSVHCPYYMKTGACKYGVTCKFDHPPPGELVSMAASQGTSTPVTDAKDDDDKEAED
ncbi:hypothetical protein ACFE04_025088 [Oxalis oulophora]